MSKDLYTSDELTGHEYRKRPVVIQAFQMTKERRWDNSEWPNWLHKAWNTTPGEGGVWIDPNGTTSPGRQTPDDLLCGTLEGPLRIDWNDWIILGVEGEIYPVKPAIFEKTHEKVGEVVRIVDMGPIGPVIT